MKNRNVFCFIVPSFFHENKGGAELQCYYLSQELLKRGWEVHYIRESRDKKSTGSQQKDGIILHEIKKRRNQLRWLNERSLLKIMNTIEADFWYCRATISYVKPLLRSAKLTGGKVIWACSSDSELRAPEKFNPSSVLGILDRYNYRLFRKSLPHINHIVLQTKYQQKLLADNFALNGEVIYNSHPKPVNTNIVRSNQILWVGRLQTNKHPEFFAQLAEKLQSSSYKFVAIGRPMKNYLEGLLLSHQEKLTNFEFLGEQDNYSVCNHISASKLLICTSDFEGFSNTFIEAWSRGVPVISLIVDPDDIIKTHNLGCVSNSIEQMYSDIVSLMDDSRLWTETSDRCQDFFQKNLGIRKAVDKLEAFIGCR